MMTWVCSYRNFQEAASIKKENGIFQVMMKEGFHSNDLNRFLIDKGIVASHIATRKKSLEKQFLEILSDASHKI